MKDGREPMRSFSDLSQFLGVSKADPVQSKKKNKSKTKKASHDPPAGKPKSDEQEPPAPTSNDEQQSPPVPNQDEQPQPPVSSDDGQTRPEGPGNQVS